MLLTLVLFLVLSPEGQKLFQLLFDKNYMKMYQVSFKVLCNKADAEDSVQDSFIKIAHKIPVLETMCENKQSGYCYVVAKNTALKIAKKKALLEFDLNLDWFESKENVEDKFFIKEEIVAVSELVKTMKLDDQNIAYLFWDQELSTKQIASLLNIKEGNVRQRIFRMRNKIKKAIIV